MAARKNIAARAKRASSLHKPTPKDELGDALGEFNEALALLRTITMAFVRADEHRDEHYSAQIISLELAVEKFKAVYKRFDLAILRVQR
jgi:hypothetical protein